MKSNTLIIKKDVLTIFQCKSTHGAKLFIQVRLPVIFSFLLRVILAEVMFGRLTAMLDML
jgi:hypothetical protein